MNNVIGLLAGALLLGSSCVQAETYQQAFETHRALYGRDHTFTWQGREYRTTHPEELEARVEPTRNNAQALLRAAQAKNKQAAVVGFEWKLTGSLLKKADIALQAGHYQQALNFAAQAKYQARKALEQHAYAQDNWQLAVPK